MEKNQQQVNVSTQSIPPQAPTPQSPQPVSPTRHIPKAAIFIIVFLILCVISFVGIYIFKIISANNVVLLPTPSPTLTPPPAGGPTANWKRYKNDQYGFEFEYPTEYVREKNTLFVTYIEELPKSIYILSRIKDEPYMVFAVIQILFDKSDFFDFNDLYDCNKNKRPGTDDPIIPCTTEQPHQIRINNKKAEETTIKLADTWDASYFIQTKEEPFIEISTGGGYVAPREVFDQILSTFKFTDSITPTCVPRPACLDATPRCLIPETPDMCPSKASITPQQIACTQEAKLCSDGSYVSRTGPNCEFSACPQ